LSSLEVEDPVAEVSVEVESSAEALGVVAF